jgi:hypothetical protein
MVCPVELTSFDGAFLVVEVNGITDSKSGRSAISHPELPTVASVILHHLFEVERALSIHVYDIRWLDDSTFDGKPWGASLPCAYTQLTGTPSANNEDEVSDALSRAL